MVAKWADVLACLLTCQLCYRHTHDELVSSSGCRVLDAVDRLVGQGVVSAKRGTLLQQLLVCLGISGRKRFLYII